MVAIGLLSLAALTLCVLMILALQLSAQNRDSIAAAQGAQAMLERIRSREVSIPNLACDFDGTVNQARLQGFPPAPYPLAGVGEYRIQYRVHSEPVSSRPGLYWIRIQAVWGRQHELAVQAYVFRP
ncbi:MAG: hypothetical protein U0931_39540 [Vulcanimicrobiota bacterium]